MDGALRIVSNRSPTMFCRSAKARFTRLCIGLNTGVGSGSDWGTSENNRKAKFYALTTAGKKQLLAELRQWDRLSTAIGLVLNATPEVET